MLMAESLFGIDWNTCHSGEYCPDWLNATANDNTQIVEMFPQNEWNRYGCEILFVRFFSLSSFFLIGISHTQRTTNVLYFFLFSICFPAQLWLDYVK